MLSELRTEDAGEVRFQAGPAQSVAQLEVEGKRLLGGGQEWASPSLGLAGWQLVQEELPPPPPFLEGLSWGRSQRAVRFLRRWRGGDFGLGVQRNRPVV